MAIMELQMYLDDAFRKLDRRLSFPELYDVLFWAVVGEPRPQWWPLPKNFPDKTTNVDFSDYVPHLLREYIDRHHSICKRTDNLRLCASNVLDQFADDGLEFINSTRSMPEVD